MRLSAVVLPLVLAVPAFAGTDEPKASPAPAAREKKDKEKKDKPSPAKVYTNEDLKDAGKGEGAVTFLEEPQAGGSVPSSHSAPGSSELGTAPDSESGGGMDRAAAEAGDRIGEQGWRDRARDHRQGIKSAETEIAKLEALLRELELDREPNPNDLLDPTRLQKRESAKTEAREQLQAMRAQLASAQKALEDLQEEARRAGVPPGWLEEPERER